MTRPTESIERLTEWVRVRSGSVLSPLRRVPTTTTIGDDVAALLTYLDGEPGSFVLRIETSNSAFEAGGGPAHELGLILRRVGGDLIGAAEALAGRVAPWADDHVRDSNGNTVGSWRFVPAEPDEQISS